MDYSKCRKGLGINEKRTSCKVFPSLGFVPLKGDILEKSRAAVEKIGR